MSHARMLAHYHITIKIDLGIGSKLVLVILIHSPALVIAGTDSKNASTKLLLVKYSGILLSVLMT